MKNTTFDCSSNEEQLAEAIQVKFSGCLHYHNTNLHLPEDTEILS